MSVVGDRIRSSPWAAAALALYAAALAAIGLWPTHVDRGAGRLVDLLLGAVPGLSYDMLEFGANVLLFLPFGVIGALFVKRAPTALIAVPLLTLFTSALIESVQQALLPGRTGSGLDVIANTLGGVIGCVAVVALREAYHGATGRPHSWETPTGGIRDSSPSRR